MNLHHAYTVPCGILLTAIGLFIRYHISRRRFNRRGIAGLQHFSSYGKALMITTIERLFSLIARLCLLAGMLLLAVEAFIHLKM
jgi:hypothetical protein